MLTPAATFLAVLPTMQLAQTDLDDFIRGLIQVLVLVFFFGLPALRGLLSSRKKKSQQLGTPTPTRDPDQKKSGRDMWRELLDGLGESQEAPLDSPAPTARSEAGPPKLPPRASTKPAPVAPRTRGPLAAPDFDDFGAPFSATISEDELERGISRESEMERGIYGEDALESGALPERAQLAELSKGFAAITPTLGADLSDRTAAATVSYAALRGLKRADLRRAIVMAEVLAAPLCLRNPRDAAGSGAPLSGGR